MDLNKVSIGKNPPNDLNVVIEVPLGGEPIKYEIDKDSGAMFVDRYLYTPMRYPCNYGFVPHTLSLDGDPIDVMCIGQRALVPGCVLRVRPVGVLMMEDDGGEDEKILAVPHQKMTAFYNDVQNYTDLPEITPQRIEHFFTHYKDLEPGKWVKIKGWGDREKAEELISAAVERAKK
ncbi:inorganic diphosphatase [Hirschia maritima]|uniref:inorganic diphosphatase n=1 Tax=Hirschia maritima TaxID=1121961 RepID=UPI00036AA4D3|nr:inorganic diphosphatase [Hirschia maritima]